MPYATVACCRWACLIARLNEQLARSLDLPLFAKFRAVYEQLKAGSESPADGLVTSQVAKRNVSECGAPDYLPLPRTELLEVISKYVNVDVGAVDVHVERDVEHDILELSVALPDKRSSAAAAGGA